MSWINKGKSFWETLTPENAQEYLNNGECVNRKNNDGSTPLYNAAVWSQDPKLIKSLLDDGADVNARISKDDPIHLTQKDITDRTTVMALGVLLEAGVDINSQKSMEKTPLHGAARWNKNCDVVLALLNAGADVNAKEKKDGTTPLHLAGQAQNNSKRIKALLKAGADVNARDNDNATPLHWLAGIDTELEAITALLDAGADPHVKTNSGLYPIHFLSMCSNLEVVMKLLDLGVDVNAQDSTGWTALHYATAWNDNPNVVIALLNAGADVKIKNTDGQIPFDSIRFQQEFENTDAYRILKNASYPPLTERIKKWLG